MAAHISVFLFALTVSADKVPFDFGPVFGDNMVLQQSPAKSAVYGYLSSGGTAVKVSLVGNDGGILYTVNASMNTTTQPFGKDFGPRPSAAGAPYNPWNEPLPMWKAFLNPTQAGGNYTIMVTCQGCQDATTISITNVTFGDVWYCSGQSNMWLPVSHTYSRNETVDAIKAGKYNNIRLMAGSSGTNPSYPKASKSSQGPWNAGYGSVNGSNPWMTSRQSISTGNSSGLTGGDYPLFAMGAACWYFAQRLAELGVSHPIGIMNTAIGGQRIEEYMTNATISQCSNRSGSSGSGLQYDATLYGAQVVPFVDMTVKGFTWYQGENNMGGMKGNSLANVGYGCMQRVLVQGWRAVWSKEPGTTDPKAPFGIVTLASSGSEGGPNMGAMRHAQTANFGFLPGPEGSGMENTFLAQAYDLDDKWGAPSWGRLACKFNHKGWPCVAPPFHQPCFVEWSCCKVGSGVHGKGYNATTCNSTTAAYCANACAASASTPEYMGGIHPRSKKPVGDRLGTAAFNTVYGGKGAFTGPTLSGCTINASSLIVNFNESLLAGDSLKLNPAKPSYYLTGHSYKTGQQGFLPSPNNMQQNASYGGSLLYVQVNATMFCMEPVPAFYNATTGDPLPDLFYCPKWAGGIGRSLILNTSRDDKADPIGFDTGWIQLKFEQETSTSIKVDLSPLNGLVPTAIRYAWGSYDCCDLSDPMLWYLHCGELFWYIIMNNSRVNHTCIAECPIYSTSDLPANPFMAKVVEGKCECLPPQEC
eukprot:m.6756 g.6756  ORF g.6756 m.6756 type:complete len:756 (+) comp3578_c0_seq2:14-2281(+)